MRCVPCAWRLAFCASLAVVCWPASPARADDHRPRAISPGGLGAAEGLATSCPTFSWSGMPGATGYELIVYLVGADGDLRSQLQVTIPGDARSWTPAATDCPETGRRYAWAVRASGPRRSGEWSEALLFETPGRPSDDEVRRALEVLRRYRWSGHEEEGAASAAAGAPSDQLSASAIDGLPPEQAPEPGPRLPSRFDEVRIATGRESSPRTVVPPPAPALTIDGAFELGGDLFKQGKPFIHNDGGAVFHNTALGIDALVSSTPGLPPGSGSHNSAFGSRALFNNTQGSHNTAAGSGALFYNTTGLRNTASGAYALFSNTSGGSNTALGNSALILNTSGNGNTATGESGLHNNTTGQFNTANGFGALFANTTGDRNTAGGAGALGMNTTGSYNTAIGFQSGRDWTTGNNNIALGRGTYGVAAETGTIRIGGSNLQTRTFIEGIRGAKSATKFDEAVCTDSQDQLGPCSLSSLRFKRDVADMEGTSGLLAALRPVTFRFEASARETEQSEEVGDERGPLEYGLIAEEVAVVLPSLVSYDAEGRPYTVRYELLTPLLLDELQAVRHELSSMQAQLADRDRELAGLNRRLETLAKKKRFRSD